MIPSVANGAGIAYAVAPIPDSTSCFTGVDVTGLCCTIAGADAPAFIIVAGTRLCCTIAGADAPAFIVVAELCCTIAGADAPAFIVVRIDAFCCAGIAGNALVFASGILWLFACAGVALACENAGPEATGVIISTIAEIVVAFSACTVLCSAAFAVVVTLLFTAPIAALLA